jgi:hypothetical protein
VTAWRGVFGWIMPTKPITHPKVRKDGKVYLGQEDVKEELEGVGAKVTFQLYIDPSGLGAADVKMAKATQPVPATKTGVYVTTMAKSAQGKLATKLAAGRSSQATAPSTKTKAVAKAAFQKKPLTHKAPAAGMGKQSAQKSSKGGPRELFHPKPLRGKVKEWRGTNGWIKPNDTIEHPSMQRTRGDLFFAQEDVEQEIEGLGATVRFMLYEDARGLLAANVRPA